MPPDTSVILHGTAVVSTLDGVTTVLVAFIFICLIFPSLVKHRSQYYAALAAVLGVIVLHTLTLMFNRSDAIITFAGVLTGLLQAISLILLVLSVGGLTVRQLAGDMTRAYEVMRRGESEKEVIIPIGAQAGAARRDRAGDEARNVYHIDTGQTTPQGNTNDEDHEKGIPLT